MLTDLVGFAEYDIIYYLYLNIFAMPFNCVLVDDDNVARIMLEYMVKKSGLFNITNSFSSSTEALLFIQSRKDTEVLFLDIDMPYFNGMELRKQLKDIAVCVFISSHPEYAIKTYELETLDFIQKPIMWERFEKTVQKIKEKMDTRRKAVMYEESLGSKVFYIRQNDTQLKVNIHDIEYMESYRNSVFLHTVTEKYKIITTLSALLEKDEFSSFIQVHKSYAVQGFYVKKIFFDKLQLKNGDYLPVGRKFRSNIEVLMK